MTDVLNWTSFCHLAQRMIDVSQKLGDDWYFKKHKDEQGGSYLVQKYVAVDPLQNNEPAMCEENTKNLIEDDQTVSQLGLQLLSYEFHVLFSLSYSVPVLYFNVHKQDGTLLKLEEIWARVPSTYTSQLETQKWSMLTQQEHPLLGMPFYMLHPCNTKHLMSQISQLNKKLLISKRHYTLIVCQIMKMRPFLIQRISIAVQRGNVVSVLSRCLSRRILV